MILSISLDIRPAFKGLCGLLGVDLVPSPYHGPCGEVEHPEGAGGAFEIF